MTKKHIHRSGAEDAEKEQHIHRKGAKDAKNICNLPNHRHPGACRDPGTWHFLKVTFRFLSAFASLWRINQINETNPVSLGRPGGLLLAIFFFASSASLR
jgi:hypothetical protein